MYARTVSAFLFASQLLPSVAAADGPEQHSGFYLRMHLGPSFSTVKDDSDPKAELRGGGGDFGIAIGGCLFENFALFGELVGTAAPEPTLEVGGNERETEKIQSNVVGFGPGVAYYFMPTNLYLSGTLVLSTFSVTTDDDDICRAGGEDSPCELYESDTGPGLSLQVGKEWWVSDNWGLGVAGRLFGGTAKDKDDDDTKYTMSSFSVLFSATFN